QDAVAAALTLVNQSEVRALISVGEAGRKLDIFLRSEVSGLVDIERPAIADLEPAVPDQAGIAAVDLEITGAPADPPEIRARVDVDAVHIVVVVHAKPGSDGDNPRHVGPNRGDIVRLFA